MVVIRLSRGGSKGRPFFNIVVADRRYRRPSRPDDCHLPWASCPSPATSASRPRRPGARRRSHCFTRPTTGPVGWGRCGTRGWDGPTAPTWSTTSWPWTATTRPCATPPAGIGWSGRQRTGVHHRRNVERKRIGPGGLLGAHHHVRQRPQRVGRRHQRRTPRHHKKNTPHPRVASSHA